MASILIVGGAGYIGAHMALQLHESGQQVIVLDNLSTGHRDFVLPGIEFVDGSISDAELLDKLFTQHDIKAVMHFAACLQVGESVINPEKYYQNNVAATLTLLNAMRKHHITSFVFSSTAAIFGEPQYIPIDLAHLCNPINPYGRSKLMVEQILADYDKAYGLKYATLRYFNACGADPKARLGESHDPESHLIPLVLQAASGRRTAITIYGDDYPTKDGTCIRDYIHVVDLCSAHQLALEQLINSRNSAAYNLGNGTGYSVKEVIDVAKQVTGKAIKVSMGERRIGDPAVLVADAEATITALNWQIQYPKLDDIMAHAWHWEQRCQ